MMSVLFTRALGAERMPYDERLEDCGMAIKEGDEPYSRPTLTVPVSSFLISG